MIAALEKSRAFSNITSQKTYALQASCVKQLLNL